MKNTMTSMMLALVLFVGVAQAAHAAEFETPLNTVIVGSCIEESIAITGTIFTSTKTTQVGQYVRLDITDRVKGEGTGLTSGIKYQVSGKTTQRYILTTEELVSFSYKSGFTLVGPGPDNNLTITYIFRQTGTEVVIDSFSASCK